DLPGGRRRGAGACHDRCASPAGRSPSARPGGPAHGARAFRATAGVRSAHGHSGERVNLGIAVHQYAASEGTGGYVVELLRHIARVHRVTLYAARIAAPVPSGVEVVRVPAIMRRAYTAILSFPLGLRAVRRRHDLLHVQGWISYSADVVTAHIVM